MVFPRTGLPNEVSAIRYDEAGTDANDNPVYDKTVVFRRPARFYRDRHREIIGTRDSIVVEGMLAFHAEPTDTLAMLPIESEVLLHHGQFSIDGDRYWVAHAALQMTWHKPSHWEVVVGRTR